MASSALVPALNAVEIDDKAYRGGGLVSNTRLDWTLASRAGLDTLVLPADLAALAVRMKEVQFSSRTRAATDNFSCVEKLRTAFNALLTQASDQAVYNTVQLVYQSVTYEGQSKDDEFSWRAIDEHWRAG